VQFLRRELCAPNHPLNALHMMVQNEKIGGMRLQRIKLLLHKQKNT